MLPEGETTKVHRVTRNTIRQQQAAGIARVNELITQAPPVYGTHTVASYIDHNNRRSRVIFLNGGAESDPFASYLRVTRRPNDAVIELMTTEEPVATNNNNNNNNDTTGNVGRA